MSPIEIADRLTEFFGERIDSHIEQGLDPDPGTVDQLGFLVAGYSEGTGRCLEVQLPSREVDERGNSDTEPGAAWRGQTDVIGRLIKGVDWGSLVPLAEAEGKGEELQSLAPTLRGLEYVIPFNAMNLQDAIDFAVLVIRTTIDVQRLTYGMAAATGSWPGVGGPIEIAVVAPNEGFQWIQRTRLQGERQAGEAEAV